MQKFLKRGFLTLLTLCLMTGGVMIMQSEQADAFACCIDPPECDPFGLGSQTAVVTGTSTADCMWAEMDFHQKVDDLCALGFCQKSFSNVDGCSESDPSPWEYSATVTYKCLMCTSGFQQC